MSKINYRIAFPANALVTIDALSNWSPLNSRKQLIYWDEILRLTKGDQEAIGNYDSLRKKYTWGTFEPAFFQTENIQDVYGELDQYGFNSEEKMNLQSIVNYFLPRIKKYWSEKNYLSHKILEYEKKLDPALPKMFSRLAQFYNVPVDQIPKDIDLNLIINPSRKDTFGRFISKEAFYFAPSRGFNTDLVQQEVGEIAFILAHFVQDLGLGEIHQHLAISTVTHSREQKLVTEAVLQTICLEFLAKTYLKIDVMERLCDWYKSSIPKASTAEAKNNLSFELYRLMFAKEISDIVKGVWMTKSPAPPEFWEEISFKFRSFIVDGRHPLTQTF